jgi:UDP-N-acetyl-D-glucosamine/UDP-N-acetyl-D-galactosamine dehydrogenase
MIDKSVLDEGKLSIAIVGLGYVGLPLAVEFSKKYKTIGFDKNEERINQLREGFDKTLEISKEQLNNVEINYSLQTKDIKDCNIYIITVPTPVDNHNNPDMRPIASASKIVGKLLNIGDIVIYESTVYPGATEEFCVPILEHESNLSYGHEFTCGYSPERINPGDKKHRLTTITKVTAGSNKKTADFVDKLYQSIITAGTYKVSSIAVAEACKVIENTQRDVNIALVNELSMIFNKLGLDTMEILDASSSKWNFLPFQPGLVGGHCIGVDPYYLTHKAKEIGLHPEIILAGRRINDNMGKYLADRTISEMIKLGVETIGAKVAILGLTFKENCPDLRNTKVPSLINNLNSYGCKICVSDPYANISEAKKLYNINLIKKSNLSNMDVIILAVAHNEYKKIKKDEWLKLLNKKAIVIDVKSILTRDFFDGTDINHWRL